MDGGPVTTAKPPSISLPSSNGDTINNTSPYLQHPNPNPLEEWSTVPSQPSFRSSAINAIAVVPLLSSTPTPTPTHSEKSFHALMAAITRYHSPDGAPHPSPPTTWSPPHSTNVTLLIPNAHLTRPGDWRYDSTPLRCFDWTNGCQRLSFFDGRPGRSRVAHDRAVNGSIGRDWIDLVSSRRTVVVVGVLNCRDCSGTEVLLEAEDELARWAKVYAAQSYQEGIMGELKDDEEESGDADRMHPPIITRLFVFDSFDESAQQRLDLSRFDPSLNLVAFPPCDTTAHLHMMDMHLAVVLNDLAVSLFRQTESLIRDCDAVTKSGVMGRAMDRLSTGLASNNAPMGMNVSGVATIVNNNATSFADDESVGGGGTGMGPGMGGSSTRGALSTAFKSAGGSVARFRQGGGAVSLGRHLFTPMDDLPQILEGGSVGLAVKEIEMIRKRDVGRREKRAGDLALLAGSPLDAYARYTHAAELAKTNHDPLWYAASKEGCAAAFIAMADSGGHGVDDYLDNNFQYGEEIMMVMNTKDGEKKVDRTKTTLPAAVGIIVEEVLGVYVRHEKLTGLYCELLLKYATYTAEHEEGHLRCRWGEGTGCYAGDGGGMGGGPRYERMGRVLGVPSINDLNFGGKNWGGRESLGRCRRVVELLYKAVSAGGLTSRTRADVAVTCAKICLEGCKATQWDAPLPPLRLPRKAALFTAIAAEAIGQCNIADAPSRAASLWLSSALLYSRRANGTRDNGSYAWASLRASILHALCQQVDHVAGEQAAELLLVLLSEISPEPTPYYQQQNYNHYNHQQNYLNDDDSLPSQSNHSISHSHEDSLTNNIDTISDLDSVSVSMQKRRTATAKNSNYSTTSTINTAPSMSARSGFFISSGPSPLSLAHSKWFENPSLPHLTLPLVETPLIITNNVNNNSSINTIDPRAESILASYDPTLAASLISLNCVIPNVRFDACAKAQSRCVATLLTLRQSMPTVSHLANASQQQISSLLADATVPPPLSITSASIVKSESHLLLERAKAFGYSGKAAVGMSMATFFNPYDNKKKNTTGKIQSTLVAEGEERTILIIFENRLSVPLDVPSCHLQFVGKGSDRIEAPPLSFTLPAKAKDFLVHFPFIVVTSRSIRSRKADINTEDQSAIFDLLGLRVTCMNRSFLISLGKKSKNTENNYDVIDSAEPTNTSPLTSHAQLPNSASLYWRSPHNRPQKKEEQVSVRVESVPAQPNLLVSFTTSQVPLQDSATVPVHLSDGEIFTIPPFHLENDPGPSGLGKMERIQILGVGLPGLPDEILFDTDMEAAARDEDDFDSDMESDRSSESDFQEMMEFDGLPPLKMKALSEKLSIESINNRKKSKMSTITFQIAATHDMGNSLANGGHVRIRFRYRGPNPNRATEIWRRREINLRIVRVKGPRISSLSFRSDLSWGSAFSELSRSLLEQKPDKVSSWDTVNALRRHSHSGTPNTLMTSATAALSYMPHQDENDDENNDDFIVSRVGRDKGVHVSGDEVVVLMAVANETNSTIVLSNRKGRVGGFQGSPMPTVRVTSGVSVKIPVVIQRIERRDENGEVVDIAAELISRTALQWEAEVSDDNAGKMRVRHGRVRIPSRCLREIIDEHKSFASRICKAPVGLQFGLGLGLGSVSEDSVIEKDGGSHAFSEKDNAKEDVQIKLGSFLDMTLNVNIEDWVPVEVISKCKLTLEFCCAKKESSSNRSSKDEDDDCRRRPSSYIWSGQIRRIARTNNKKETLTHRTRLSFVNVGTYVVSACVKINAVAADGTANASARDSFGLHMGGASAGGEEIWWAPKVETVIVQKEDEGKAD